MEYAIVDRCIKKSVLARSESRLIHIRCPKSRGSLSKKWGGGGGGGGSRGGSRHFVKGGFEFACTHMSILQKNIYYSFFKFQS